MRGEKRRNKTLELTIKTEIKKDIENKDNVAKSYISFHFKLKKNYVNCKRVYCKF